MGGGEGGPSERGGGGGGWLVCVCVLHVLVEGGMSGGQVTPPVTGGQGGLMCRQSSLCARG